MMVDLVDFLVEIQNGKNKEFNATIAEYIIEQVSCCQDECI